MDDDGKNKIHLPRVTSDKGRRVGYYVVGALLFVGVVGYYGGGNELLRGRVTIYEPRLADCSFARDNACDMHHRQLIMNKIQLHLAGQSEVFRNPETYAEKYAAAKPFPHIHFDGMFPEEVLKAIAPDDGGGEFPENWASDVYKAMEKKHLDGKATCDLAKNQPEWRCIAKQATGFLKLQNSMETTMGPNLQGLMAALKSTPFITFLEKLTGIAPLYSDPTNFGSGMHQIMRGGSLQIHADFRRHPQTALDRRVNVFIYLNDNWEEEWGGELELWNKDMDKCEARIATSFGRIVIFSTNDFSYHGHSDPLNCPPHRTRRSIAMYYYSPVSRPADTIDTSVSADHGTLYKKRKCASCSQSQCQA